MSQLQKPEEVEAVLRQYAQDLAPQAIKKLAAAFNSKSIGIKQLLMVLEMARSSSEEDGGTITPDQFLHCLHTVGF